MSTPRNGHATPMVVRRSKQARGSFNGGQIMEWKPVGFPGEATPVKRVGPLFYWAWAVAHEDSVIGMHPHQGFEIASVVLTGKLEHLDTAGNREIVDAGGLQLMQTGSGISHEERMPAGTEFFQIWFEPDLRKSIRREPTYTQFEESELPCEKSDGVFTRQVLGMNAPASLEVDVDMRLHDLESRAELHMHARQGRILAVLLIKGSLTLKSDSEAAIELDEGDFLVLPWDGSQGLAAAGVAGASLAVVDLPDELSYPLLRK